MVVRVTLLQANSNLPDRLDLLDLLILQDTLVIPGMEIHISVHVQRCIEVYSVQCIEMYRSTVHRDVQEYST